MTSPVSSSPLFQYFAYTRNVPGCFSNGKTIEEAKRNIRQAIEQHLVSMLAHAQPKALGT